MPQYSTQLEKRTETFAKDVRAFSRVVARDLANIEDIKQLIRSSGSVGSNYIEANEAFSLKDKRMRLKICRKEAKESRYWLRLIDTNEKHLSDLKIQLEDEANQLLLIFSSIIQKI